MISDKELDNWFTYHAPKGDDPLKYEQIRSAGRFLARAILRNAPAGVEQSEAILEIRKAVMMANAAIACAVPPESVGEDILDAAAQAAHEVNRVFSLSIGERVKPHWEDLTTEQRDGVRQGVRAYVAACFQMTPEQIHDAWVAQRRKEGWTYGVAKHEARKEHPNLRPYNELSVEQRRKDALFLAVVRHVVDALGEHE